MYKILSFLLSGFLLSGCATEYKKKDLFGGYDETQLNENTFQVSFSGNEFTEAERTSNFTLLRSAEVAIENGFRYFIIVKSEKHSSISTYTTPAHSYTTGNNITTYGGTTEIVSEPIVINTIICFKKRPKVNDVIFDAEFIEKSLKQKYNIKSDT